MEHPEIMWQTLNAWLLELLPYMAFIAKNGPLLVTLCSLREDAENCVPPGCTFKDVFAISYSFQTCLPLRIAISMTSLVFRLETSDFSMVSPHWFPWFWGRVSPPMLPIFSTFFSAFWGGQNSGGSGGSRAGQGHWSVDAHSSEAQELSGGCSLAACETFKWQ